MIEYWFRRLFGRHRKPHIYVMAVAVRTGENTLVTLPRPARHHDIIAHFSIVAQPEDQGFVTSDGVFVDRVAALEITRYNGQFLGTPPKHQKQLFSEDVW